MKIANVADPHFRGKDLEHARAQGMAMANECIRRGVGLVTVAGDLFDRPTIGDQHASTGAIAGAAIEVVKRLTDAGIDVLMITGNHDQSGPGSADALHVFDGMDGVIVVRDTDVIALKGKMILCLPWQWNGDAERELSRFTNPTEPMMLLAHVEVIGSRMGGTRCCESSPGKWQISRQFLETLPVDHIALGHFHARQDLTGRGGYIGSLRQCNFGEEGNAAGFEIWDTQTGLTEWVELDAAPKHQTVIITDPDKCVSVVPGSDTHLRVRYDGVTPDAVEVKRLESQGVVIEQIIDRAERIQRAEVPQGILTDRRAMMHLWASSQNPPVDGLRLERMIFAHDGLFADKGMACGGVVDSKPVAVGATSAIDTIPEPEWSEPLAHPASRRIAREMTEDQLPF